jgi:hypothetical protein
LAGLIQQLSNNSLKTLRFKSIECSTEIQPERRSADIEASELDNETVAPGDTLKATVTLRPFKGARQRIVLELKLPADMSEGNYTALIGDELNNVRADLRDNPHLGTPQTVEAQLQMVRMQMSAKRTTLVMRVPLPNGAGVAVNGQALNDLPPSMVQMLSSTRRTNAQTIHAALVARSSTNWVVNGADMVRFRVTKNPRANGG